MGIEPTYSAWKADILPLKYTRGSTIDSITGFLLFVNYFFMFFEKFLLWLVSWKKRAWFVSVSQARRLPRL